MRYSWISDTATIASRFDPDTSLIDPRDGNPDSPATNPEADADTFLIHRHADDPDTPDAHADTAAGPAAAQAVDIATAGTEQLADRNPATADRSDLDQLCGPATSSPGEPADESDATDFAPVIAGDLRQACVAPGPESEATGAAAHIAPAVADDLRRHEFAPGPESAATGAEAAHLAPAVADDLRHGTVASAPENPYCEGRPINLPFVFPTQQGRLTHLNVTIAATTLAGLDDLPGELDGYGPIPADLCRTLAVSAASITALGVDPSCGTALDVGRTTYRPRLSHRDHVTQRDRTCRFPGCRQPARRCQIDHSEEFCDGGPTCPCNLACLCKFHHDLKTTGLWDAQQHPDASITWTSPTGRTYRTHTPMWPIATLESQPEQDISTMPNPEGCAIGTAPKHAATARAATDEPPF